MKLKIIPSLMVATLSGTISANEVPASYTANSETLNVHNRCIVRFNDALDSSEVKGLAHGLATKANASIKHIYKHSIKGFTINTPCSAAAKAFGKNASVSSFSADGVVSINKGKPIKEDPTNTEEPPQAVSYGTIRVGSAEVINNSVNSTEDGTGYTAWVIDTGVDLTHPDLNIDTSRGFTVFSRRGRPSLNDENGHGSHVAGTIGAINNTIGSLGVAPNTTIIPVRVLDRNGSGSYSGVLAGIDHVAYHASKGDCVNMSLGGGISSTLDDAVTGAALSSGAFFALAAGNEGDDANNHSPARAEGVNVWTISAIDNNDNMPSWSNYGSHVDYAAPGVSIFSLWKNGGSKTISGTSMATPHACAVLMLTNGSPSTNGTANNDPDNTSDPIIHL